MKSKIQHQINSTPQGEANKSNPADDSLMVDQGN
jgi:hypothetical protein